MEDKFQKEIEQINKEWSKTYWENIIKIKERYDISENNFYNLISDNSNITWDIIKENIDKPWDWYDIKNNPNITWDIIRCNPKELNRLWSFDSIYTKSNIAPKGLIDLNNLVSYDSNLPNFWKQISRKPDLTWETIKENLYKDWDWFYLSFNPTITWDIIENNKDIPWSWYSVSKNPNITWDIVEKHIDKPWNFDSLSLNPNITWDIIKRNLDKNWNWYYLSQHPNITLDIIKNEEKILWDWDGISLNPNVTLETFLENKNKNWNLILLCKNQNISWEILEVLEEEKQDKDKMDKMNMDIYIRYVLSNKMTKIKERFIKRKLLCNYIYSHISDINVFDFIISGYI